MTGPVPIVIDVLPPADWQKLEPVFQAQGVALPSPTVAQILAATQGDRIVGFVVVQLQVHLEPIWVDPTRRGQGIATDLAKAACDHVPPGVTYFAFAPRPGVANLATRAGLQALPWTVFRGVN